MKMFNLKIVLPFLLAMNVAHAAKSMGNEGGGGDPQEIRVNEIRSDISSWIEKGGARKLKLPKEITYKEYVTKMSNLLVPQKVIVSFTNDDVLVNGTQKTCKGFISLVDTKFHILCNIMRFKESTPTEQYRLVHHEYAGLNRLEKNEGAASDYQLSSQITHFLVEEKILRLSTKNSYDEWQNTFFPTVKIIKKVKICGLKIDPVSNNTIKHIGTVYYTTYIGYDACDIGGPFSKIEINMNNVDTEYPDSYYDYDNSFSDLSTNIVLGKYDRKVVDLILSDFSTAYPGDENESANRTEESLRYGLTNIKIIDENVNEN
jgi:hypothetical protein